MTIPNFIEQVKNPLECAKYMEEDLGQGNRSQTKKEILYISFFFGLLAAIITAFILPNIIWMILLDFIVGIVVAAYIAKNLNTPIRVFCTENIQKIIPGFDYMDDLDCKVLSKTLDKIEDEDYPGNIIDLLQARFLEIKKGEKQKIEDVKKILKKDK